MDKELTLTMRDRQLILTFECKDKEFTRALAHRVANQIIDTTELELTYVSTANIKTGDVQIQMHFNQLEEES